MFACEVIGEVDDFELPAVAHEDIADVQILHLDLRVGNLLEEHLVILHVVLGYGVRTISIWWFGR